MATHVPLQAIEHGPVLFRGPARRLQKQRVQLVDVSDQACELGVGRSQRCLVTTQIKGRCRRRDAVDQPAQICCSRKAGRSRRVRQLPHVRLGQANGDLDDPLLRGAMVDKRRRFQVHPRDNRRPHDLGDADLAGARLGDKRGLDAAHVDGDELVRRGLHSGSSTTSEASCELGGFAAYLCTHSLDLVFVEVGGIDGTNFGEK